VGPNPLGLTKLNMKEFGALLEVTEEADGQSNTKSIVHLFISSLDVQRQLISS